MKIFSTFLLLALASVCFVRCSKDDSPDSTSTSQKMTDITASTWVYESAGVDLTKDGTVDFPFGPTEAPPCLTDNKLTFKSDNTAIADEGTTKCNTSDPQTSNFNWNFADNENSLNISSPVFSVFSGKLKIVSLTSTKFVLSRDTVLAGTAATLVVNLKH